MEMLTGDEWVPVQFPQATAPAIGLVVAAGETQTIQSIAVRNLNAGRFRIVKTALVGEETVALTGEFEVRS